MNCYTIAIGKPPSEIEEIIRYNVQSWGMEIVELEAKPDATVEEIVTLADNFRWERARWAETPELYIDWDCKLFTVPADLESPALPVWPSPIDPLCQPNDLGLVGTKPQPDTFLMYVSQGFAEEVMERAKDRSVYCWPRKVLRDWPGINVIPESCYEHGMYSSKQRRRLQAEAKTSRAQEV